MVLVMFFIGIMDCFGQFDRTANDEVKPYTGEFGYGANMGAYPPWRDENLANIAAGNDSLGLPGFGINAFRPELPELFVEYWGYDIRVEAFEHYDKLGMKDHVLFVGQPSPEHRDTNYYCEEHRSKLFQNLYTPIWDNGENGTPYNDTNYFARYVHLLAENYGDQVKFWEVWNEPDLDVGGNAPLGPQWPGNWWTNDPPACEVHIFAPIHHYIRMLRITYEVVKSVDPDDYIAVGGLGNPSFLDAILRNSDNPVDGSITTEFPYKGGAYFDCMSFHSYPHLDGSMQGWNDTTMDFVYFRHSDRALDGLLDRRQDFEDVLTKYGYDGNEFPKKEWILTESNIPRISFTEGFIGTANAQRNFLTKALVSVQQYDVRQFHVYSLADVEPLDSANYEFEVMGLVKNLTGTTPHEYELTETGIAYGSCASVLGGYRFNDSLSQQLHIEETDSIRGCAFTNSDEEVMYVLWAKTYIDSSEYAYHLYDFDDSLNIQSLERYPWHYLTSKMTDTISTLEIPLTGEPVFLKAIYKDTTIMDTVNTTVDFVDLEQVKINVYPNPTKGNFTTTFYLKNADQISASLFDVNGKRVKEIFNNRNFNSGEVSFKTEIATLPGGIYYLKIRGEKHRATARVAIY